MRKAYKYRIYLTNGQRRILEQQLEECRWVYNETLAYRKRAHEEEQRTANWYETKRKLPDWKKVRPSLKLVHSQVLQNVTQRVDLAFQAFFRRVKAGVEDPGYPRFKGKGRYDSITYPQYGAHGGAWLDGDDLILSKVGRVHVVWHRPTEGQIKTVTLRWSSTGKWYVAFLCEVMSHPLPPTEHIIGVDVGLESFLTTSDGEKVANPRFFRRDEQDLARVQRAKDKAKNEQNWPENARRKKALARIHERIAWRRGDFAHQTARRLVDAHQIIAFEDLNILDMVQNRRMSKSIADAAWSQLIQYTSYKAVEAGRTVVLVNPRNTSKMCSQCGALVQKTLADRVHVCPQCGLSLDRDQNAAINILRLGLQSLEAHVR
jgi:putative transposase